MKKSDDKMVKLNHDTKSLQFLGSTQYMGTGCAKVKTHGYKHSLNINTIQRNAKHSLFRLVFYNYRELRLIIYKIYVVPRETNQ